MSNPLAGSPNQEQPPQDQTLGLMEQLREQNRRMMEEMGQLRQQVSSTASQLTAPPPPPSVTEEDYQANPFQAMRRMIGEIVAPLAQSVQQTQRLQGIDRIVAQCKEDDRFKDCVEFENIFRSNLANLNVFDFNTVQAAYFMSKGMAGSIPKPPTKAVPNEPPQNTQRTRQPSTIPPHLIPSGGLPGGDNPNQLPKLRQLNEYELKISKEQRMSHHKWLFRAGEIDRATFDMFEEASKPKGK